MAEKIRAFLTRAKGRDLYDLWFLLEKGVKIDPLLVDKKLEQVGKKFNQEVLLRKIKTFPPARLKTDLGKFLPKPHRKIIPILKENLQKAFLG